MIFFSRFNSRLPRIGMKETLNEEEIDWTLARVVEIVKSFKNVVVKSEGKGPV